MDVRDPPHVLGRPAVHVVRKREEDEARKPEEKEKAGKDLLVLFYHPAHLEA